MRMDPTIKRRETAKPLDRRWVTAGGVAALAVAVVILGLSLWESLGGVGRVRSVTLPGFHRLALREPGLYAGFYQHRGPGAIPAATLSKLNVRILSKDDFEEVPVLMNSDGQVVERFGVQGMPLFNFVVRQPGDYTLSAVYDDVENGPSVPVFIFPQSVQNARTTLVVGFAFFALFIAIGVVVLRRSRASTPSQRGS